MSSILFRCIKSISALLKSEVCNNVSFHSQSDFVQISSDRNDRFPAIIIRGPITKKDNYYQAMNNIINKNIENLTFVETPIPEIYDVYFKLIIFSEGDIEGLEILSKIIKFFGKHRSININDFDIIPDEAIEDIVEDNNSTIPIIVDSTYNISTGDLTLIGRNFTHISGNSDIDSSKFSIIGRDNDTKILPIISNVEIINSNSAIINIPIIDRELINLILDKNGVKASDDNLYNLYAEAGWNGNTSILNNCRIVVSGVPIENMTYTTYNINLIEPNENNIDNMSDLSRYEAQFCIEGVEFSIDESTSGKLASEIIPDVNTI